MKCGLTRGWCLQCPVQLAYTHELEIGVYADPDVANQFMLQLLRLSLELCGRVQGAQRVVVQQAPLGRQLHPA